MAALVESSHPVAHSSPRAGDGPPLVLEESLDHLASARRVGDPAALRRCEAAVMKQYQPVADRIARRYRGRGVEDDDLIQLARLGLLKSVRRWRPELDPKLVRFAIPTVEGEIKRYFRDHCRPIRMPRSQQEDLGVHQRVQDELTQALRRSPTEHEIATVAGTSVDRVRRQRLASRMCQPVSADASPGSMVAGIGCQAAANAIAEVDEALALGAAVRRLSVRDRRVLRMRFIYELSQVEIGARIGVSQMQVSRLLRSILTGLQSKLAA